MNTTNRQNTIKRSVGAALALSMIVTCGDDQQGVLLDDGGSTASKALTGDDWAAIDPNDPFRYAPFWAENARLRGDPEADFVALMTAIWLRDSFPEIEIRCNPSPCEEGVYEHALRRSIIERQLEWRAELNSLGVEDHATLKEFAKAAIGAVLAGGAVLTGGTEAAVLAGLAVLSPAGLDGLFQAIEGSPQEDEIKRLVYRYQAFGLVDQATGWESISSFMKDATLEGGAMNEAMVAVLNEIFRDYVGGVDWNTEESVTVPLETLLRIYSIETDLKGHARSIALLNREVRALVVEIGRLAAQGLSTEQAVQELIQKSAEFQRVLTDQMKQLSQAAQLQLALSWHTYQGVDRIEEKLDQLAIDVRALPEKTVSLLAKREAEAARQSLVNAIPLAFARSTVSVVGIALEFAGAPPETVVTYHAVFNGMLDFIQATQNYVSTVETLATGVSSAAIGGMAAGNYVGAIVGIVAGVVRAIQASQAASELEITLDAIADLRRVVLDFAQRTERTLVRIDTKLAQGLAQINVQFAKVNTRLGRIEGDVGEVLAAVEHVSRQLERIQRSNEAFHSEDARAPFVAAMATYLDAGRNSGIPFDNNDPAAPSGHDLTYLNGLGAFELHGLTTSRDNRLSPSIYSTQADLNDPAAVASILAAETSTASRLTYLAQWVTEHTNASPGNGESFYNPRDWAAAALASVAFAERHLDKGYPARALTDQDGQVEANVDGLIKAGYWLQQQFPKFAGDEVVERWAQMYAAQFETTVDELRLLYPRLGAWEDVGVLADAATIAHDLAPNAGFTDQTRNPVSRDNDQEWFVRVCDTNEYVPIPTPWNLFDCEGDMPAADCDTTQAETVCDAWPRVPFELANDKDAVDMLAAAYMGAGEYELCVEPKLAWQRWAAGEGCDQFETDGSSAPAQGCGVFGCPDYSDVPDNWSLRGELNVHIRIVLDRHNAIATNILTYKTRAESFEIRENSTYNNLPDLTAVEQLGNLFGQVADWERIESSDLALHVGRARGYIRTTLDAGRAFFYEQAYSAIDNPQGDLGNGLKGLSGLKRLLQSIANIGLPVSNDPGENEELRRLLWGNGLPDDEALLDLLDMGRRSVPRCPGNQVLVMGQQYVHPVCVPPPHHCLGGEQPTWYETDVGDDLHSDDHWVCEPSDLPACANGTLLARLGNVWQCIEPEWSAWCRRNGQAWDTESETWIQDPEPSARDETIDGWRVRLVEENGEGDLEAERFSTEALEPMLVVEEDGATRFSCVVPTTVRPGRGGLSCAEGKILQQITTDLGAVEYSCIWPEYFHRYGLMRERHLHVDSFRNPTFWRRLPEPVPTASGCYSPDGECEAETPSLWPSCGAADAMKYVGPDPAPNYIEDPAMYACAAWRQSRPLCPSWLQSTYDGRDGGEGWACHPPTPKLDLDVLSVSVQDSLVSLLELWKEQNRSNVMPVPYPEIPALLVHLHRNRPCGIPTVDPVTLELSGEPLVRRPTGVRCDDGFLVQVEECVDHQWVPTTDCELSTGARVVEDLVTRVTGTSPSHNEIMAYFDNTEGASQLAREIVDALFLDEAVQTMLESVFAEHGIPLGDLTVEMAKQLLIDGASWEEVGLELGAQTDAAAAVYVRLVARRPNGSVILHLLALPEEERHAEVVAAYSVDIYDALEQAHLYETGAVASLEWLELSYARLAGGHASHAQIRAELAASVEGRAWARYLASLVVAVTMPLN